MPCSPSPIPGLCSVFRYHLPDGALSPTSPSPGQCPVPSPLTPAPIPGLYLSPHLPHSSAYSIFGLLYPSPHLKTVSICQPHPHNSPPALHCPASGRDVTLQQRPRPALPPEVLFGGLRSKSGCQLLWSSAPPLPSPRLLSHSFSATPTHWILKTSLCCRPWVKTRYWRGWL